MAFTAQTPTPTLAWQFENSLTDDIQGVTGTPVGSSLSYVTGKYQNGLNIPNPAAPTTPNYFSFTTTGTYTTQALAVACWVNFTNILTDNYVVMINRTNLHLSIWTRVTGVVVAGGPGSAISQTPTALANNRWYHLVSVLDGTNVTLYVDGVAQVSNAYTASSTPTTLTGVVGVQVFTSTPTTYFAPFKGIIDDLRIFDRALTSAQVQSIYNQQGMPGRGLTLYNPSYIKSATGGDIVQDINGFRVHIFTTVGNSTFTPATSGGVEVLIVAGGGGGGGCGANQSGGGGGAGELIYIVNTSVSGAVSITVGGGGNGGTGAGVNGTNGAASVFGSLTALGGGFGGTSNRVGNAGGSGGGGGRSNAGGASTKTIGLGNTGGSSAGNISGTASGGGGGGATTKGQDAYNNDIRTPGGSGYTSGISGTTVVYASGGSGGARGLALNGANGAANTGNGGGGGDGNAVTNGGAGGSGVVFVRYPTSSQLF